MRRWFRWIVVVVVGLALWMWVRDSTLPPPGTVDDHIAIYRAIRAAEPFYQRSYLYEKTALPWTADPSCTPPAVADDFRGMHRSLLKVWCTTNRVPQPHNPLVIAGAGFISTSTQEGAFVSSAIQFDPTTTQALVVVFASDDGYAMGTYFWLRKHNGHWRVAGRAWAFIT